MFGFASADDGATAPPELTPDGFFPTGDLLAERRADREKEEGKAGSPPK
jgi:hypothetical protein